jgi:uracil-DNA glycosylase family 4
MDARTRHRMLMSLRSEAAMGLSFIEASAVVEEAFDAAEDPPAAPPPRVATARPEAARAPAAATSTPLLSAVSAVASLGGASLPPDQRRLALKLLDDNEVRGCPKCRLSETRTQTVFGEGDPEAAICFVGEAPGADEDATGRPFVGRAGQLLDKMIAGMGLDRGQVYIVNVCKCRPPDNRPPATDEAAACTPYLVRQLEIIRPKVIVTLGLTAAKFMFADNRLTMGKIRGRWSHWRGVRLMPTYHPSYVLRYPTPEIKRAVWDDLKLVMAEVGLVVPARRGE